MQDCWKSERGTAIQLHCKAEGNYCWTGKMAVMRSTELQPPYLPAAWDILSCVQWWSCGFGGPLFETLQRRKNLSLLIRTHISPDPRQLYPFRNDTRLYGEEELARLLTPKLEDHALSAVRNGLYSPCWRPFLHPQTEDAPCRGAPLRRPSMYGGEDRCIQRFGTEYWRKEITWKTQM